MSAVDRIPAGEVIAWVDAELARRGISQETLCETAAAHGDAGVATYRRWIDRLRSRESKHAELARVDALLTALGAHLSDLPSIAAQTPEPIREEWCDACGETTLRDTHTGECVWHPPAPRPQCAGVITKGPRTGMRCGQRVPRGRAMCNWHAAQTHGPEMWDQLGEEAA